MDEVKIDFVFPQLVHQTEEWKYRDEPARGYFWEMGTGKSKQIIDNAAWLFLNDKIDTLIYIAKKGEYRNFKLVELPKHMPEGIEYACEIFSSYMKEWEKQKIRNLWQRDLNKLRILCVNVESMSGLGGQVARYFAKSRNKGLMLVVDESTCVKSTQAERSKAVYELSSFAKYKRIMSGTPITRSPLDLWGQSKALGKMILGHSSLYSFKGEYCVQEKQYLGKKHFMATKGYKNLDLLNKQVKTWASVIERADVVDLPPKIYMKVEVPLTDRQQELYESMRELAIAELQDGTIVDAVNALGIISRLDQIACGQLRRDDGTFEIIESNRPEALLTKLEHSRTKGIIWCNYRGLLEHLYYLISLEYGPEKVGRFYGSVPDEEREASVVKFNDPDDKLQWIVANQQSMGYGRTMTIGKENFYYSNGYNLEHRLQSEDRTMRIGQNESVLYVDYFSDGTINQKIHDNLRSKKNLAQLVLGTRITDWI